MIFHDEIRTATTTALHELDRPGTLVCGSTDPHSTVSWYFTDSTEVPDAPVTSMVFQQTRNTSLAVLLRGSNLSDASDQANGIWTCKLNGTTAREIPVGIYRREDKYLERL